ncbi:MAG: hypothetical protein BWY71_00420 [Planctomycetes bacterium ADurb.Bin412]|nr:MAG: hypothetical protein BWY71_00420 [Planctomycetes bacterium ADurb.Bin412]
MAYKILVVDDSATMRALIKRTLTMSGLEIERLCEAGSGKQALDLLTKESVDLILADINMPEMNGIEMAEQVLANPATCRIPVVVVSTEASQTRIQELKTIGVKGFIHKPFTPEQIRDAVVEILGACHAEHV